MTQPVNFLKYKYKEWARGYVFVFESSGRDIDAANAWARDKIPKEHRPHIRPYVEKEFTDRGYAI
jgi:hypothetical protein